VANVISVGQKFLRLDGMLEHLFRLVKALVLEQGIGLDTQVESILDRV
jgi:hypothetical protein